MAFKIKVPPRTRLEFITGVRLRYRVPKSWAAMQERAQLMATDETLVRALLRQAIVETLLVAYRARFLARLPLAVATEREGHGIPLKTGIHALKRRLAARRALVKAYDMDEGPEREDAIRNAQSRVEDAVQPRQRAKRKLPGTGRYRSLALQVLRFYADQALLAPITSGSSVGFGIGSRKALDAIQTPSATPLLRGHPTTSRFTALWRQLEFGTGAYRRNNPNAGSPFRIPGGGWVYGPTLDEGLRIKGTRGIHALTDPTNQLPYDSDAIRVTEVFHDLLNRALYGRRT